MSQQEFVRLLCRMAWIDRAALVAFQVPPEIGRLALRSVRASHKPGRGGTAMTVATVPGEPWRRQPLCENGEIEEPDLPRVVILPIDGKRSRVWFKPVKNMRRWDGVFVSLQPMAETFAGEQLDTLQAACEAFEIECPPAVRTPTFPQALAELRAECRLYSELLMRHVELSPDEPPTPYVSAGTYAKATVRRTGLRPPLRRWPDIPREALAATMGAYHAGELSVHVRGPKVPVRALDFGGAYGISARLIQAWDVFSAEEVWCEDVTPEEAAGVLQRVAAEFGSFVRGGTPPTAEAWQAAAWMTVFIEPRGELLPHRPRRGETWSAVRAPISYAKGAVPWQGPDIVVHLLERGVMPTITRAFRLRRRGRAPLRLVSLPTGRTIDPAHEDLVALLHDERARAEFAPSLSRPERRRLRGLLKGMTVSLVSGLPIQVNDDEPTVGGREQRVLDPRTGEESVARVNVLETPGDWYFPPMAAAVTATARLLLHTVIQLVRAAGGIVAYWDTDSVLVVATGAGGLFPCPGGSERMQDGREAVRALSYVQVEEIRRAVDRLLPIPDDTRPHADVMAPDGNWVRTQQPRLLKLEPENFTGPSGFRTTVHAATRASKKYHLYQIEHVGSHVETTDEGPMVIEPTAEHADRAHSLHVVRASEHGLPFAWPTGDLAWVATGYEHLLQIGWGVPTGVPDTWEPPALRQVPASSPQILARYPGALPFCKLAVGQIRLGGGQVVAPMHRGFSPMSADWRDTDGRPLSVNMQGVSLLRARGEAQLRAWNAADERSVGPDGRSLGPGTEGVVEPLRTIAPRARIIGKESRHLGLGRGVLHSPEFVGYGGDDDLPDVIDAARRLCKEASVRRGIREALEVEEREFAYLLSGGRKPSSPTRARLIAAVAKAARRELRRHRAFSAVPESDVDVIAALLDSPEPERRCLWCGKSLTGRATKWCPGDVCRKRAERWEQMEMPQDERRATHRL